MKSLFCLSFCCFWGLSFVCSKEFCISEVFQPSCPRDKLIHITSAIYGRKEFGRCLRDEGDFDEYLSIKKGYINCFTDVRHIIEPQCAGQQRCEVYVSKIEAETKCNKIFRFYLDAEYQCLRGYCCFHCTLATPYEKHSSHLSRSLYPVCIKRACEASYLM